MKKRGRILLLLVMASAFLFSCGIPSYFYLESSDYSYRQTNNDTTHQSLNYELKVNDSSMLSSLDDGLSLMLFYCISTDTQKPLLSEFSSAFKTRFMGTDEIGVGGAYDMQSQEPVIKTNSYNLCPFYLEDGVKPETPVYIRSLNNYQTDNTLLETLNFTLVPSGEGYFVNLSDGADSMDLQRFYSTSSVFTTDIASIYSSNTEDGDYRGVSNVSSLQYYIHIYSTFTAQKGDFSNRYWASLKYLGYLTVNVPLD